MVSGAQPTPARTIRSFLVRFIFQDLGEAGLQSLGAEFRGALQNSPEVARLHRNAAELAEQGLLPEPVREFVAKDRGCRELDRFLGCFERRLHRELRTRWLRPGDQFQIFAMYVF